MVEGPIAFQLLRVRSEFERKALWNSVAHPEKLGKDRYGKVILAHFMQKGG